MADKGTVVRWNDNKGFGRVEREGGKAEAFLHISVYPAGQRPGDGDVVEVEVDESASKGPKVTKVLSVTKAGPNPTPAAQPTSTSNKSAQIEPLDVIVEFLYDVNELKSTSEVFELPIVIKVTTTDNKPVRAAQVILWFNGNEFKSQDLPNFFTNQHGEAHFFLSFDRGFDETTNQIGPELNITRLFLIARVRKDGKELVVTETVPRSQDLAVQNVPKPPAAPVVPPQPELTVTESEGRGYKEFLVRYGLPDALIPAIFKVRPTRGCELAWREAGNTDWKIETGKFTISTNGRIVLQVKIHKLAPGVGGENIFVGIEGIECEFGPCYISRHQ